MKLQTLFMFSFLLAALTSCKCGSEKSSLDGNNEAEVTETGQDANKADRSLEAGEVDADSQLLIEEVKEGTGETADEGMMVEVHYEGSLESGRKFDSSRERNQAFSFKLGVGQVIRGWDEGIKGMKVGGIRKLIIPPTLAYGEKGAGGVIPPNATLIFEVELLSLNKQ